ncbi:hypothetical protein, partial [Phytohabitans kaempferiae]
PSTSPHNHHLNQNPSHAASGRGTLPRVRSPSIFELAQTSMPYQDPTPEMLEKQAADIAAAERIFTVSTAIAGALALIGLAAFFYSRMHRQTRTTHHGHS